MKRGSIIILGVLFSFLTFGQEYYPMVVEGKQWNNLTEGFVYPGMPTPYSTQTYKISGDTIVNNINCSKLYLSEEEYPVSWELKGYVWEDDSKKVWMTLEGWGTDCLMYDFSIQEQDSIMVGFDPEENYLRVDSISIVEINNEPRKKYWLSSCMSNFYTETWIEGIGSDKGLMWSNSVSIVGSEFHLLCAHDPGDVLIYMNPTYEVCYLNTVSIDETEEEFISLYPNPTKDYIQLSGLNNHDFSFEISSNNGQVLKSGKSTSKSKIWVNDLPAGMYILKIDPLAGTPYYSKFIKE